MGVDPDQTASIGAVCSGSTLFASLLNLSIVYRQLFAADHFSIRLFSDAVFLGALRVKLILCNPRLATNISDNHIWKNMEFKNRSYCITQKITMMLRKDETLKITTFILNTQKTFFWLFLCSNQYWLGVTVCVFLCQKHPRAQPTVVLGWNVPRMRPRPKASYLGTRQMTNPLYHTGSY